VVAIDRYYHFCYNKRTPHRIRLRVQIVAAQGSGIKTFADLTRKSLSVGASKSGTEVNARRIFDTMGMSYKDLGKTECPPFGESMALFKNRQLDAMLQSVGRPGRGHHDPGQHMQRPDRRRARRDDLPDDQGVVREPRPGRAAA
jgi:hypothetical protein